MHYDFQTLPQRRGTGSAKWELMYRDQPDLGPDVVPLSVADMEFENPPEVKQALRDWLDGAVMGYTDPTDEFFSACLGWQERRHGWTPKREWVATSPGVVPAIFNAVRTLTSPGDGVIVQPPVYYPFFMAVEASGRRIVRNPLVVDRADGAPRYRMDFDDLERKAADPANTMLVLCSPHNPVGRVWTRRELERVLDICARHGVTIVADEIHDDLIMPGVRHTAILSVARPADWPRLVVCTAPSKTFNIAGCQASVNYVPAADVRERFVRGFRDVASTELNCFAYPATIAAYTLCDEWLGQLLGVIWSNYQMLRDFMREHMPEVEVYPLEGTYLAWTDFGAWGLTSQELERFMHRNAQLYLDEGHVFGSEGDGFERFNLACPEHVLHSALERLNAAARNAGLLGPNGGSQK